MTIEEAKEILKAYDFSFTGCTGSLKEAISTVLPIVEKYQKIEQAYSAYLEIMNPDTLADLISTII